MKKILVFFFFLLILISGAFLLANSRFRTQATERILNASLAEYFKGSLRLKGMQITPRLHMEMNGLSGTLKTTESPFPLEISKIRSKGSLYRLFTSQGLGFEFEGIRPLGSAQEGVRAESHVRLGKNWRVTTRGKVQSLQLNEIQALNPENLRGSSGLMKGDFLYDSGQGMDPHFEIKMDVQKPGGSLQARFFALFLPYLPKLPDKVRLAKLASGNEIVGFSEAKITGVLESSDKFKIFFHILVPDYNLNLNLNLEIRIDEKNAFPQLAALLGLIKVTS